MRNVAGILLVLALLGVFMLPGLSGASPDLRAALQLTATVTHTTTQRYLGPFPNMTGTPRAVMPVVLLQPTNTPTRTPTPTITPTPTRTSTPSQTVVASPTRTGVPGATGLTGRVLMQKARYYAHTEWIFFYEQLRNATGSPKSYTILGVNVSGPIFYGNNPRFHTSWTGAPDWVLSGCWGPNGATDWNIGHNYRCAPNENEGWHEDHIGASSNVEITQVGHYWVEFFGCLSSHSQCISGQGAIWQSYGIAQFDADQPPAGAHSIATSMPQVKCGLITTDPDNIYMKCND